LKSISALSVYKSSIYISYIETPNITKVIKYIKKFKVASGLGTSIQLSEAAQRPSGMAAGPCDILSQYIFYNVKPRDILSRGILTTRREVNLA